MPIQPSITLDASKEGFNDVDAVTLASGAMLPVQLKYELVPRRLPATGYIEIVSCLQFYERVLIWYCLLFVCKPHEAWPV